MLWTSDLLRNIRPAVIVSDIAVFVVKRDVKLQPTNQPAVNLL